MIGGKVLASTAQRRSRCRWRRSGCRGPVAFIQPTTRSRPILILVGERQAGTAAAFNRTDSGEGLEIVKKMAVGKLGCHRTVSLSRRGDPVCLARTRVAGSPKDRDHVPSVVFARRLPRRTCLRAAIRGADRQRACRARVRSFRGEARRAILGRPAPDYQAALAYLLEESRRSRACRRRSPGTSRPAPRPTRSSGRRRR